MDKKNYLDWGHHKEKNGKCCWKKKIVLAMMKKGSMLDHLSILMKPKTLSFVGIFLIQRNIGLLF